MAGRLMRIRTLLAVIVAVLAPPALAEGSPGDPTRPPAAAMQAAVIAGEPSGPVLQSVMMPKKGNPVALISGQQVTRGEMYGDSRLLSLTEREAVLKGPAGTVRLFLTPGVVITSIVEKNPAARRGQSKGKP